MSAPILHAYLPDTGEYVGPILADPDPEQAGEWLHPAFAIEAAPPERQAGKAIVIRDGAWALLPDHRGETWFAADGSSVRVDRIGDPGAFKPPLLSEAPELPPSVPEVISDRQFAQALAKLGVISRDEALQFVKVGAVPAALQAVIDNVEDPDARFDLDMAVSGATTFERSNPSTIALAEALQWSPEQMDDLWHSAAAIR